MLSLGSIAKVRLVEAVCNSDLHECVMCSILGAVIADDTRYGGHFAGFKIPPNPFMGEYMSADTILANDN